MARTYDFKQADNGIVDRTHRDRDN